MSYDKLKGSEDLRQGNSFSRSVTKLNGSIWEATEEGYHELVDTTGTVVSTAPMTKSADDLALIFAIPDTDTLTLLGNYILQINLTDSGDPLVDVPLVEYTIVFKERIAV